MTFLMIAGWFGVIIGSVIAIPIVLKKLNLFD
jgi:hypothetical protein